MSKNRAQQYKLRKGIEDVLNVQSTPEQKLEINKLINKFLSDSMENQNLKKEYTLLKNKYIKLKKSLKLNEAEE